MRAEVPDTENYEQLSTLLKTLQERHWVLLYSIGQTRVFGRRGQIGGSRVYAEPGDVLFFEEDQLCVTRMRDDGSR